MLFYIRQQKKLILSHLHGKRFKETILAMINYRDYTRIYMTDESRQESDDVWHYLVCEVKEVFGVDITWD